MQITQEIRRKQLEDWQSREWMENFISIFKRAKELCERKLYRKWRENDMVLDGRSFDILKSKIPAMADGMQVEVNYLSTIVYTMLPMMYFKNPHVDAHVIGQLTDEDIYMTVLLHTAIINKEIEAREAMFKKTNMRAVYDALVLNFGAAKVGYAKKLRKSGKFRGNKSSGENPAEMQTSRYIEEDSFFTERIDPFDIVFDCMVQDLEHIKWVGIRYVKSLGELEHDMELDQEEVRKVAARVEEGGDHLRSDAVETDLVEYYEIWVKARKDMGVPALHLKIEPQSGAVLYRKESPYDFFPVKFLVIYPQRKYGFGYSLPDLIMHLVLELTYARSRISTAIKHMQRILGTPMKMNETEKNAIEAGKDMVVLDGLNERGGLQVVQVQLFLDDLLRHDARIKDDIRVLTAIADFRLGGQSKTRSATEAAIADSGFQSRHSFLQDNVKDFVLEIINCTANVMHNFYTGKKAFQLPTTGGVDNETGKEMEKYVNIEWEPTKISEYIGYSIDISSMTFVSNTQKLSHAMALLAQMSQNQLLVQIYKDKIRVLFNEIIRLMGFDYLGMEMSGEQQQRAQQDMQRQAMEMYAMQNKGGGESPDAVVPV